MRIPQLVAGALVARQAMQLLPSTYCSPECPSCKTDVGNFDGATTSCVANSSFIQNCGLCQSCVTTYAIENGGIDTLNDVEISLINILNLCENTTVSTEIAALQSQASRMSVLGAELATTTDPALASLTGSITMTITSAPTTTGSPTGVPSWMTMTGDDENTSWQSILSTATWASYYYSHKSAQSASLASVSAALAAKQTSTSSSTANPTQSATPAPLSPTWIAGPVVGSVMGMCTVFTVIFFTRRKQRKEEIREIIKVVEIPKEFHDHDNDSAHSPAPPEKAQLPPEPVPPVEAQNTEIYEMPAVEPVGSELNTPMDARMREDDWPVSPMPLSPLPLLFAMSELRDQRNGVGDVSPRHDTFYHP